MNCECHIVIDKIDEPMNCHNEAWFDEDWRDYYSLNIWIGNWIYISQKLISVVLIQQIYNFESNAYHIFL